MAIWQSASLSADVTSGWIGRWLDRQPHNPFNAIGIGSTLPPLMVGEKSVASMVDVGGIGLPWDGGLDLAAHGCSLAVRRRLRGRCGNVDLGPLHHREGPRSPCHHVTHGLVHERTALHRVDVINANVPTRVWEVNLSSFDTHTGEVSDQNALLAEVDAAVGAFMTSIGSGSRANDVTVMIYSEFGRRVMSNASDGTDHGTSAPVFLIGNSVKGGLYGEQPSLSALDVNGNLQVRRLSQHLRRSVAKRIEYSGQ